MVRRLLLLNGVAILAVAWNHAAWEGFIAMFWWTDLYRPGVTIPNYDQFNSLSFYGLIAAIQLSYFAVPSFLFVSGFFVAYTARGQQSTLSWKMVRVRVTNLLIPYVIWSLAIFFSDWLLSCFNVCELQSPSIYLIKLLTGQASGAYWYVTLICQLYLLSPWLVQLAKTRMWLLLLVAGLGHLGGMILGYLHFFENAQAPGLVYTIFDSFLFPQHLFYFVFGIVAGFHLPALKIWLSRLKWGLLAAVIISAILALIEARFVYQIKGGGLNYNNYFRGGDHTLPMTFYIITVILSFLAFEEFAPFS
ncbi:MAG: acyltransferase, partial [Chloroflexota bacterium]